MSRKPRKMQKQPKLWQLMPVPILLLSSACALVGIEPAETPRPQADFCTLYEPVSYDSELDTPETVAQVEPNNARWLVVCDTNP